MLTQAFKLDISPSDTSLEAAMIESDAIKTCDPPYNVALTHRHRCLWFISHDFSKNSDTMDKTCPLGPVSAPEPFAAAYAIGSCLSSEGNISFDVAEIMALPEDRIPDQKTFQSGLDLFHDKHWTPQMVAGRFESICRRCGFMLRRSRWFSILSESTLAWRTQSDAQNKLNILMIHKGDIRHREQIPVNSPVPKPLDSADAYAVRRARIDLMRYDRLRVLTTEMRRLISENRLECVRIGEKVSLPAAQIERLLEWIYI